MKLKMEKFLKQDLKLAKKALIQAKTEQEYINIINKINTIYNIQDELFTNKQNSYNLSKYCQLGMINPNQESLTNIANIIDIYADMPLLETESFIEYPTLKSNKNKDLDAILNFWNYILKNEIPTLNMPLFTFKNVDFINYPAIKRIFTNGKCMVYHSFVLQQPKLILKRFYNIKDFVNPCGIGIMMIPQINKINSCQMINTIQYYMRSRALHMYQEINPIEANKLHLIINDNLIYNARELRKLMSFGFNNISLFYRGKIIDFINHIIGIQLSNKNNITLEMILEQYHENDQSLFDLCSYNEIVEKTKKISLKYKKDDMRKQ